ncbi:putative elongator complex protein 1 [Mucor velutinosus]|uniref:Elongator complex protein 1 n=1 Tax=Mucor velutinosus TaxID=708070 RepID=A0AAN7D4N6_9FUNG|nr:putative elongator complex protein 1 [Mucor velutinosus]
MSDLNQILSLLKGQNVKTPTTATDGNGPQPSQLPSTSTHDHLAGLNLSSINPALIQQVRQEYLTKKSAEDSLRNATSLTPEVLIAIANMAKETELKSVLKKCKQRQDAKEKELYAHREYIKSRYKKQKENVMAKELIGVKVDASEIRSIDRELDRELRSMDLQILKEMDKEARYLQQEFVRLKVPLFKVSNDPNDLKLQQKVLFILQDI